jgi:hypothetical protein
LLPVSNADKSLVDMGLHAFPSTIINLRPPSRHPAACSPLTSNITHQTSHFPPQITNRKPNGPSLQTPPLSSLRIFSQKIRDSHPHSPGLSRFFIREHGGERGMYAPPTTNHTDHTNRTGKPAGYIRVIRAIRGSKSIPVAPAGPMVSGLFFHFFSCPSKPQPS